MDDTLGNAELGLGVQRFDGDDYRHRRDSERLTGQLERVYRFMLRSGWVTLLEIAEATDAPQASASAQLRNLRKERFGKHDVRRRHEGGGLYSYRLHKEGPGASV